jgi:hypothetical protein
MDYKYIEQLLERYWNCQTTLEEERILRSFFSQEDMPAQLLQYKSLFECETEIAEEKLGDEFDARIMQMVKQPKSVKLARLTFKQRIMPLVKAVAVVAVIITIGNMFEDTLNDQPSQQTVSDNYVKSEEVANAYTLEEAPKTASADSIAAKQGTSLSAKETNK